jgi:hypothetical protein
MLLTSAVVHDFFLAHEEFLVCLLKYDKYEAKENIPNIVR